MINYYDGSIDFGYLKNDELNKLRQEHLMDEEARNLRYQLATVTNEYNALKAKCVDLEAEINRQTRTIETLMNVKKTLPPISPDMGQILVPILETLRDVYWDRNKGPELAVWQQLTELILRCKRY